MSSVYSNEPSTNGKVIVYTSHGEIDIELWSAQAPTACKQFVQHCLDGYYDSNIFHRFVCSLYYVLFAWKTTLVFVIKRCLLLKPDQTET